MGGVGRKGGYLQGCLGRMMGWDGEGGEGRKHDKHSVIFTLLGRRGWV